MSKHLNRLPKIPPVGVASAPSVDRRKYEPSSPRIALGFAGVAMTAIVIAISVILPAQIDSGSHEPRMLAPSKANAPASVGLVAVTSINVVGVREPGSSTVPVRIGKAAIQSGRLGTTTLPAVVHVSTTDR
jgi:hypothetical protein